MRPFKDSDTEVTIHWYKTDPALGTLPYPSRINSLSWRPNQFNPGPVGEVSFEPQVFDGWGRIIPPIMDPHILGTRSDFEDGGSYLPDEPPVVRGPDGIPVQCRPPLGGVGIGGTGVVPSGGPTLTGGFNGTSLLNSTCTATGVLPRDAPCFAPPFFDAGSNSRFITLTGLTQGHTYRLIAAENGSGYTDLRVEGGGPCGLATWFVDYPGPGPWDITFTVPVSGLNLNRLMMTWPWFITMVDAKPLTLFITDIT